MARPVKLTSDQRVKLLTAYANGVAPNLLAQKYDLSLQHVYRILKDEKETREEKLSDHGQNEGVPVVAQPPRKMLSHIQCNHCHKATIKRYAENKKQSICSRECFEAYKAVPWRPANTLPDGRKEAGSAEFAEVIIQYNSVYFPDIASEDELVA